jgi:hypothetical protein
MFASTVTIIDFIFITTDFNRLDFSKKLSVLWNILEKWSLTLIGKSFFVFSFSFEDLRRVLAVGSWSLSSGILHLYSWTSDFNQDSVFSFLTFPLGGVLQGFSFLSCIDKL